jgi:hypothetical protein
MHFMNSVIWAGYSISEDPAAIYRLMPLRLQCSYMHPVLDKTLQLAC